MTDLAIYVKGKPDPVQALEQELNRMRITFVWFVVGQAVLNLLLLGAVVCLVAGVGR